MIKGSCGQPRPDFFDVKRHCCSAYIESVQYYLRDSALHSRRGRTYQVSNATLYIAAQTTCCHSTLRSASRSPEAFPDRSTSDETHSQRQVSLAFQDSSREQQMRRRSGKVWSNCTGADIRCRLKYLHAKGSQSSHQSGGPVGDVAAASIPYSAAGELEPNTSSFVS